MIHDFDRNVYELLVFVRDPFLNDVQAGENLNQPEWKIIDVIDAKRSLVFHLVAIPRAISDIRSEKFQPICVRFFSPTVCELRCCIVYMHASDTVGDLIKVAARELNIDKDIRLRIVDVENHTCEILSIHLDDSVAPVSTLLCWGARNIFLNCARIEQVSNPDFCHILCHHYDRSMHKTFGHPFVLEVRHYVPEGEREVVLRQHVSEKLNVPLNTVRAWRLRESQKHGMNVIEIIHPYNPWTHVGTPQEKALFIKG
jgi:hypothetical protein